MIRSLLLAATLGSSVAAAALADVPVLPLASAPVPAVPRQLSDNARASYRQFFQLLRAGSYQEAANVLAALPADAVTPVARAELLLAAQTTADRTAIGALLAAAPDLPEAPALARLAPDAAVALPAQHPLVRAAGPSKRAITRVTRDSAKLSASLQPLLRNGDLAGAEAMVEAAAATVAPEAVTEWRQKVAWAYFQAGDDASARRVAALAQVGAGDWSVDGGWVNGLASWRAGDFPTAAAAFDRVAGNAGDTETRAAGLFWAARSKAKAGDQAGADQRLQSASRLGETFYGMLAKSVLGVPFLPAGLSAASSSEALLLHPNVKAAAALVEVGETALADQLLRYQARIGAPDEHGALVAFAGKLGLCDTQVWLAHNAPAGTRLTLEARYPVPGWAPPQGWRVDPALLFAHALQESELRPDAVSPAGARGLMQLMPGTAQLIARHKGDAVGSLADPSVSFEYGQSYLEELASTGGTGGLLPKVIAAYNAGPNNVARWTNGQDDPLLFIESIPFAETRAYVAIVLRNYWIYQRETGAAATSLADMAQGKWPMFPVRRLQTASAGAPTYAPN